MLTKSSRGRYSIFYKSLATNAFSATNDFKSAALESLFVFTHKLIVDEFRKPKLVLRSRTKFCESHTDVREDLAKARKQAIPKLAT